MSVWAVFGLGFAAGFLLAALLTALVVGALALTASDTSEVP